MAFFSVVIPVYNVEKYIANCLDSILNQTFKDFEVICVDDGSSDGSLSILNAYAQKDVRVKVFTQRNLHAGIARNKGLDCAVGEYVHFMDADDVLLSEEVYSKLNSVILANEKPNILKFKNRAFDNSTGDYIKRDLYECSRINEKNRYLDIKKDWRDISNLSVTPWSAVYKRKFLTDCGIRFNDNICCNDRSFNIMTILEASGCYLSDVEVVNHRLGISSLTSIRDVNFECHFKSLQIIFEYLMNNKCDNEIFKRVTNIELNDLFTFYRNYCFKTYKSYSIYKQMVFYFNNFDIESLRPDVENFDYYYTLLNLHKKNYHFTFISYWVEFLYDKFYTFYTRYLIKDYLRKYKGKKVVFWGASLFLRAFLNREKISVENVVGIIDSNYENRGKYLSGIPIFLPNELDKLNPDCIIMTVENRNRMIYKEVKCFLEINFPNIVLTPNVFKKELIEFFSKIF